MAYFVIFLDKIKGFGIICLTKENEKTDISLRIVTDHTRCISFMIADGIIPSNEGRGYVLRMILRRALRHGYLLGLDLPFLEPIVNEVISRYCAQYPELKENEKKIVEIVKINISIGRKEIEVEAIPKNDYQNKTYDIARNLLMKFIK